MNFYEYIGISREEFEKNYLDTRLVNFQHHDQFPLAIYTYGREAVHDGVWDNVTLKCRGIVVNRDTGEIVARPFEKFFNFGSSEMPECSEEHVEALGAQPVVWEKMDGFLCTLYQYNGESYIASKGSFSSPHAKWATAWYRKNVGPCEGEPQWPEGYTPVFEGITPNLRIVVDYGKTEKLVLLALINKETGEELNPVALRTWAAKNGVEIPRAHPITWQTAQQSSYDDLVKNEEGYVLTWYRAGQVPFRLKMKFIDYLRLHRMVTGVSPKRILEVLQNGWTTEMDDLLNDSTPWFNKFVAKWKRVIEGEYKRLEEGADKAFSIVSSTLHSQFLSNGIVPTRKDWALLFTRPEYKEFAAILFARFDGKDIAPVIWKMVKNNPIMKGGKPLVDGHNL